MSHLPQGLEHQPLFFQRARHHPHPHPHPHKRRNADHQHRHTNTHLQSTHERTFKTQTGTNTHHQHTRNTAQSLVSIHRVCHHMCVGRVSRRELLRCGGPGPGAALLVGSCVVSSPSALGGRGTHADVTPMTMYSGRHILIDSVPGAEGVPKERFPVRPMMWPDLKETELYLRTAGGMMGAGCGSSRVRRSRTLSRTKTVGGSVTPSVHLAVSRFLICDVTEKESGNNVAGTRRVGPRAVGSGC